MERCALEHSVNDRESLNNKFVKDFQADNGHVKMDHAVTSATWLNAVEARKEVGPLVVWSGCGVVTRQTDTNART